MAQIVVSGDTSGSCTLVAPAVAGGSVLTLPVATDTLVGKATTDVLTNKTLTSPVISGTPSGVGVLTSGTVNSGGTNPFPSTLGPAVVDFTGIPSWVKRITVLFSGVSTNGSSSVEVRIGSGSITASGYVSYGSGGASNISSTTGFLTTYTMAATYSMSGKVEICLVSGSTYIASGTLGLAPLNGNISGGTVTLGGALDRVRITTVNGTDLFDAGSINIMYE